MVVERKPHPSTYQQRPLSVELILGGKKVRVFEAVGLSECDMLVSSTMFTAILKETRRGKASQKAKT